MWWQVLFWILLIPLVVAEVIIFVKTRRLFWLFYALSIFVYVVAVSYTLDVFDASRNAVILTLLASAALMVLVGRHLGKDVKKKRAPSRKTLWMAGLLLAIMAIVFVVSAIFGTLDETVVPATSIDASKIVLEDREEPRAMPEMGVVILERRLSNDFFLPVPIPAKEYQACLETTSGTFELYPVERQQRNEEVPPYGALTRVVEVTPRFIDGSPHEINVYIGERWSDCSQISKDPDFTIPVV